MRQPPTLALRAAADAGCSRASPKLKNGGVEAPVSRTSLATDSRWQIKRRFEDQGLSTRLRRRRPERQQHALSRLGSHCCRRFPRQAQGHSPTRPGAAHLAHRLRGHLKASGRGAGDQYGVRFDQARSAPGLCMGTSLGPETGSIYRIYLDQSCAKWHSCATTCGTRRTFCCPSAGIPRQVG